MEVKTTCEMLTFVIAFSVSETMVGDEDMLSAAQRLENRMAALLELISRNMFDNGGHCAVTQGHHPSLRVELNCQPESRCSARANTFPNQIFKFTQPWCPREASICQINAKTFAYGLHTYDYTTSIFPLAHTCSHV